MTSVLLLGGYGGFGRRIARRLASDGHEVIVAGRSRDKARAFCAGRSNMRPLQVDLRAGLADVLERERPWALVDAAGPFQQMNHDVAKAAIAAGCHYLDIADARKFVCGIGALDPAARAAGVAVISGASSDPALTGAVARALAQGMEDVRAVEIALSVSGRAAAGSSVSRATLSYAGRPIRSWRGGRSDRSFGWQEMRSEEYLVTGRAPMRRSVALIDVPSLELLPARLPGRPSMSFRAGGPSDLQNHALWLLTWLVRWGWLSGLERLHSLMRPWQYLTARIDPGRSGMTIRMYGLAAGRRIERRWTIIAERDQGRDIPCLTVPLLLRRIAAGELAAGARDAGELLELADFEPELASLSLAHEVREIFLPEPLYSRVMKQDFDRLPATVRRMHALLRDGGAAGEATVVRGRGLGSRIVAAMVRFPPEGDHPLHVRFEERGNGERWTRSFSDHCFHSDFAQHGSLLVEKFGLVSFGFELKAEADELRMILRRWWIGPLPLPLALAPRAIASEREADGRFHFDVDVALPLLGRLVHYRGWLEPLRSSTTAER